MAIKVKHEGNVTSRAYASAAGGKGRRQSEDALRLAQIQASASGRSGGTSGGARASAQAPTTRAPTSSAALGSTGVGVTPQLSEAARMRIDDNQNENALQRIAAEGENRLEQIEKQSELSKALHEYDWDRRAGIALSEQGQRERDALIGEVIDSIKSGAWGDEEIGPMLKSLGVADEQIAVIDALRRKPPTPQEQFDQNIVTDPTGNKFYRKPNGSFEPLPNPEAEARAEQEKAEAAKREKEIAARNKNREKFIADALNNARKNATNDDGEITVEELKVVKDEAGRQFDELYPDPNAAPIVTDKTETIVSKNGTITQTEEETVEVPSVAKTVEDAKKKWGVRK